MLHNDTQKNLNRIDLQQLEEPRHQSVQRSLNLSETGHIEIFNKRKKRKRRETP